jgi:flagellar hook-length control protein FliK
MTQAIIPLGTSATDTGASGALTSVPSANPADWSNALAQAGSDVATTKAAALTAQPVEDFKIPPENTEKTSAGKASMVQTDAVSQTKDDTRQPPETEHNVRATASDKPAALKDKNTGQSATSLSPFASMLLGVAAAPVPATPKTTSQNLEKIIGQTTPRQDKQNASAIPAKDTSAQPKTSVAHDTQTTPEEMPAPETNNPKSVPAETQAMANTVIAKAKSAMTASVDSKNTTTGIVQTADTPPIAALPDTSIKVTATSASAHAGATTTAATPAQAGNAASARAAKENLQAIASAAENAKSNAASTVSNTTSTQQSGPQAVLTGQTSIAPSASSSPSTPVTPASVVTQTTGSVAATPAALAATITAMHQTGQNSTVLRLDPPGLGSLSVHVALGQSGQVNVLFVPSTAQTAQLLHSGMDGLRQAMATSGLTLGQADVNGGSNQSSSQGGQSSPNNPGTAQASQPDAISTTGTTPAATGVRAYA